MSRTDIDYTHDHVFLGSAHDENAKRTLWVVALTVVMMIGEITAGYITGSMALLADGFHMATHAGALGIAAAAYGYAKRHATSQRYSFGTGKVGDLGGFASALILGIVALGIGVESVMRLLQPTPVQFGTATLIAVVGLLVNIVSALLLGHGHDHDHDHDEAGTPTAAGKQHADLNLRAAYLHVLADAATSVAAILALLAGRLWGADWLDPVIGIAGAILVGSWALGLLRQTGLVLLDAEMDAPVVAEIRDVIAASPVPARILDLHVWRIGKGEYACMLTLETAGTQDPEVFREQLRIYEELVHITVELREPST